MGSRFKLTSLRTSLQISSPESFGSIKSRISKSGGALRICANPVVPSPLEATWYPSFSRL
jgi:hypothetical protein